MKNYSQFEIKRFKFFLIIYLLLIISYNFYVFATNFPSGWLAVILNTLIIVLLLTRSKYLKIILRIWSMLFLIITSSIQLFSKILKKLLDNNYEIEMKSFFMSLFFLTCGIIIFYYSKTIVVKDNMVNKDVE